MLQNDPEVSELSANCVAFGYLREHYFEDKTGYLFREFVPVKDLLAVLRQQDTENLAQFVRAKSGFAYTPRVQFMKNKVGFITRSATQTTV